MTATRSTIILATVVFMGAARAQGQVTETIVHRFTHPLKGSNPLAGVVRDPAGNLYGTTSTGGFAGGGTVYRISPSGQQTVLHSFTGPDGTLPNAGVTLDEAGNLYALLTTAALTTMEQFTRSIRRDTRRSCTALFLA